MATQIQFDSPDFRLVARGLLALHRLIREGRDDSPEADVVRDALDSPLAALSDTEKRRAQWLSEDLYSISEPPSTAIQGEMDAQTQGRVNEASEARQHGEWDRALALLRRGQGSITPSLLSHLRGSIWMEAGVADVAEVFHAHASECDPTNASYGAIYFHALNESRLEAAGRLAREESADDAR